ncbi:MAG TPA: energy transducer TonB [Candidatus Acidoferrales bacterium]|nr:energy transducer TonB [Candidatus Acidoferrales bacterium]
MPTTAPSNIRTVEPLSDTPPEQRETLLTEVRGPETSSRSATAQETVRAAQPRPVPTGAPALPSGRRRPEIFHGSLLDLSSTRPRRSTKDFAASIFIHLAVIGVLVLAPFMFTEAIDLTQFTRMQLVAPPPPPPPPPPPAQMIARRAPVKRVLTVGGKLVAPTMIPQSVVMLHEKPLPPELDNVGAGIAGGVPGGVPGGQAGGVLGSILSGVQKAPPPPVAAPARTEPIRVGGRVKPPRKIYGPLPEYPVLARQARVEGNVIVDAVIDTSGNVIEAKVISGPPLLMQAALDAVRQWKFEPTYLNDQPVPVRLLVTVEFSLGK